MAIETAVTGYGARVGGSIKAVGFGAILIVASVVLLFWNEGRTLKRTKTLQEGEKVSVSIDANSIDPANEDKLVHISGDVVSDETLSDPQFGISLPGIALRRKVEVYQWQENSDSSTERQSGGSQQTTTTYSYERVWSEDLINSNEFKESGGHENPTTKIYESQDFLASVATLGAFKLSPDQIKDLEPSAPYDPNNPGKVGTPEEATPDPATSEVDAEAETTEYRAANVDELFAQDIVVDPVAPEQAPVVSVDGAAQPAAAIPATSVAPEQAPVVSVDGAAQPAAVPETGTATPYVVPRNVVVGAQQPQQPQQIQLIPYPNGYYIGNPQNPQVGDERITFSYVASPCPTSFVGQQHGDGLIEYQTKYGALFLQESGIQSKETMFANAKSANKTTAWLLRLVGFALAFIGFKILFEPLTTIADIIPFASRIVEFGSSVISFCLALFVSLTTIAVGWIYYRPVLGISILVVAIAALVYPFVRGKKNKTESAPQAPTA